MTKWSGFWRIGIHLASYKDSLAEMKIQSRCPAPTVSTDWQETVSTRDCLGKLSKGRYQTQKDNIKLTFVLRACTAMNPASEPFTLSSLVGFRWTEKEKIPFKGPWRKGWTGTRGKATQITYELGMSETNTLRNITRNFPAWLQGGRGKELLSAVAKTVPPPLLSPSPIHGLSPPIGSPAASNDHDRFSSSPHYWLLPMAYYQGRANPTRNQ